jgi:hypothetical protein
MFILLSVGVCGLAVCNKVCAARDGYRQLVVQSFVYFFFCKKSMACVGLFLSTTRAKKKKRNQRKTQTATTEFCIDKKIFCRLDASFRRRIHKLSTHQPSHAAVSTARSRKAAKPLRKKKKKKGNQISLNRIACPSPPPPEVMVSKSIPFDLPHPEVAFHLFDHLDVRDLTRCRMVSTCFRAFIDTRPQLFHWKHATVDGRPTVGAFARPGRCMLGAAPCRLLHWGGPGVGQTFPFRPFR